MSDTSRNSTTHVLHVSINALTLIEATEYTVQLKTKSQLRKVSTLDFLFWGVLWRRLLRSWGLAFREKHFCDHDVPRRESLCFCICHGWPGGGGRGRRWQRRRLYECMMSGGSKDGLEPLNPVDPVEGGVGQDLVHHLHRLSKGDGSTSSLAWRGAVRGGKRPGGERGFWGGWRILLTVI